MTLNLCKCFDSNPFAGRPVIAAILTAISVLMSGCFRVGLPEYFCEVGSGAPAASAFTPFRARLKSSLERSSPLAAVVTADQQEDERTSSLGHQYLLGILPFTRVFAQHGVSSFAEEVAGRILTERGYRVVYVPRKTLARTLFEMPLSLIVAPRPEVRVNAFDLFVVRMAAISGEVACDFYSPSSLGLMRTGKGEVEESEYRKQAQAPVLADLLERSLRSGIEKCLRQAPSLREARLEKTVSDAGPEVPATIWILAPEFSRPPAPTVGQRVAGSYGYDSVSPFSYATLLRLMQKGVSTELAQGDVPAAAMLSREIVGSPSRALRIVSDCLELSDDEEMRVCFTFSEESFGATVRSDRCEVRIPLPSRVDGALAVSLERSAAAAAAAFMKLPQPEECAGGCTVRCAEESGAG